MLSARNYAKQWDSIMALDLVMSILFIGVFLVFWYLQIFTRVFSTRYYLQVGLLFVVSVASVYLAIRLLTFERTALAVIGAIGLIVVAIYHGALCFVKVLIQPDSRYRRLYSANRAIVNYSADHQRFTVRTDDG